jgi:hypothetical protein
MFKEKIKKYILNKKKRQKNYLNQLELTYQSSNLGYGI